MQPGGGGVFSVLQKDTSNNSWPRSVAAPSSMLVLVDLRADFLLSLFSFPLPPLLPPSLPSSHPYCSLSKPYSLALSWLCSTGVWASCGRKVHTDMTSDCRSVSIFSFCLHLSVLCGRKGCGSERSILSCDLFRVTWARSVTESTSARRCL